MRLPLLVGLLAFFARPALAGPWRQLDVYLPLYTYHLPYAYSSALRRTYNDEPFGAGLGVGGYGEGGNWDGVFAMEFADSHGRPQYNAGYAWLPIWRPFGDELKLGAGLAGLLIARSDFRRYTPFPGILPLGSVGYRGVALQTTFVPGGKNNGNILFTWVKLTLF